MSTSILFRPTAAALAAPRIARIHRIPAHRTLRVIARSAAAPFHTISRRSLPARPITSGSGRGDEEDTHNKPARGFSDFDVFADTPAPATSVDACTQDGFHLNSGTRITGGDGVLLVGGEAFRWRPWVAKGDRTKLVNGKGQWEVPEEVFGALGLVWPRPGEFPFIVLSVSLFFSLFLLFSFPPLMLGRGGEIELVANSGEQIDLLILGVGPEMRPISPETRSHIARLGMRVEVLDTRNAAAQFNLLATERGVEDVAAALIPVGWKEGKGVV